MNRLDYRFNFVTAVILKARAMTIAHVYMDVDAVNVFHLSPVYACLKVPLKVLVGVDHRQL